MKRLLLISSAVICVAANAAGQALRDQTAGKPNRRMASGTWLLVRTIGLDTDLFAQPIALAAKDARFVVADGDAIQSFTVAGEREWRFGRTGSGPGEFRQILSVAMDAAGNALVYDGGLERLTVIDRGGKLRHAVPLTARTDRAAFSNAGRYLLLNTASDTLARIVDSAGVVSVAQSMPPELRQFAGLSREMSSIISSPAGHLVTLRWSSHMMLLSPSGVVTRSCTGIDSLSFPDVLVRKMDVKLEGFQSLRSIRVDPRARPAALRAAMLGNQLLVEPSVASSRRHVLDVYARDCGKYVDSRPFPYPATQLAGTSNFLIAMLDEPVPHVVILRWVPR